MLGPLLAFKYEAVTTPLRDDIPEELALLLMLAAEDEDALAVNGTPVPSITRNAEIATIMETSFLPLFVLKYIVIILRKSYNIEIKVTKTFLKVNVIVT